MAVIDNDFHPDSDRALLSIFQSDISRNEFLLNRYNINSGLTGRLAICKNLFPKFLGIQLLGMGLGPQK